MDIFLSRLSRLTTQKDLETAVFSLLSKKLRIPFTSAPELCSCKIMDIQDEHGSIECHGLINIRPDSAAEWFIKHSHSKKIHNKSLLAHQYMTRDSSWRPPYPEEAEHRRSTLKKRIRKEAHVTLINEGTDTFRREH